MLKTRLMTAAAAVALFAAPAALAQEVPASPVTPTEATTATVVEATPAQSNSVVAVLRADGRFTTLLSAIEAAGLTATLEAQPAVSIFAPTDEAFAAVPEAERTRLMDPANREELRALLLYHVIAADVQSSQITGARGGVPTANGAQVQLDGTGDAIKIDAATVVTADIDASNGAVFAIDKVLMPSASQAAMGDEEEVAPAASDAATTAPTTTEAAPVPEAMPAEPAPESTETPVGVTQSTMPTAPADAADEATTADQPPVEGQEQTTAEPEMQEEGTVAAPPAGEGDPAEDEEPADPQA